MHPLLKAIVFLAVAALVFWGVLAIVDRLQKRKTKNFPQLDAGPDDSQNADIGGSPD
jgi:hypothetical protein